MANANLVLFLVTVIIFAVGYFVGRASIPKIYGVSEGFVSENKPNILGSEPSANNYETNEFAGNASNIEGFADSCVPDPDKYVLRSTIPPCPQQINLDKYILKSEIPSQVDLSKYVLKSSVPKCAPCICANNNKPAKIGQCPPCERCPPLVCPTPAPCDVKMPEIRVEPCKNPRINCKAEYPSENAVKPTLASMSAFGF